MVQRPRVRHAYSKRKEKRLSKVVLAWLKDKESAKFMIPALYQPCSLIPLCIWKASPSTTNGNEQAHRNINRDGVGLTLLAGVMRGQQHDTRMISSINLHVSQGVNSRDTIATHTFRATRSISRTGTKHKHKCESKLKKNIVRVQQRQHDSKKTNQRSGRRLGNHVNHQTQQIQHYNNNTSPNSSSTTHLPSEVHPLNTNNTTPTPTNEANHPFTISTYSTLTDAFNTNVRGKREWPLAISIESPWVDVPPRYNAQQHYSTYSTLSGALG